MKKRAKAARMAILAVGGLVFSLGASAARASSDDAWGTFAKDVEKACSKAATASFAKPTVIVDPFGSERFGLAVVTGKLKGGSRGTILCVYDKQTKKVEIGSELGEDAIRVEKGKKK